MKPTGALPLIISAVVRNRLRVHLTFGSYSAKLSFFFFFSGFEVVSVNGSV